MEIAPNSNEALILFIVCYVVVVWTLLEILFWVAVHFHIIPSLQALKPPAPFHKTTTPGDTLLRVLALIEHLSYKFDDFVNGFFRGAKLSDLKQDNIRSFLSWAVYNEEFHSMEQEKQKLVDEVYDEVCRRFEISPEPGSNPAVKHVSMTMEPIPVVHRPLFVYVFNGIIELFVQNLFLRTRGFRNLNMHGMSYWLRNGPVNATLPPLIVLHGITPGWSAYSYLIHSLLREQHSRSFILIDVGAIKINSLCFNLFSADDFCRKVKQILSRHGYSKCSLIGHSFGSITAGWFVHEHPEMVSHITLVDPVTILLAIPEVAYNFLYKPPVSIIDYVIRYAASRELTISNMLHRHFWWYRNNLWLEDLPDNIGIVVALSELDPILNATVIQEYVEKCRMHRFTHKDVLGTQAFSHPVIHSPDEVEEDEQDDEDEEINYDFADDVNATSENNTSARTPAATPRPASFTPSAPIVAVTASTTAAGAAAAAAAASKVPPAPISTLFWPGFTHGQCLVSPKAMKSLTEVMHLSEKNTLLING